MFRNLRAGCLRLHRWFGLAGAAFFVLIGLTGCVLAFYEELDAWMTPELLASARPDQEPLDLATLAERAQALAPEVQVVEATWRHAGRQAEIRTRPWAGAQTGVDPGFDSLLLDPWTGAELGRRTWGDIRQGTINLVPFVYRLHYELALGHPGMLLLGLIALGWTLDCFVGLLLTLPMPAQRTAARRQVKSFWSRWAPAWRIKHPASSIRRLFDLHRAFSLWCWLVLLVFAWSSVSLNLPSVYEPVMRTLTGYQTPAVADMPKAAADVDLVATLSWPLALSRARLLMAEQAAHQGLTIDREVMLRFMPDDRMWLYRTRTNRDVLERRGATDLYLDAGTGDLVTLQLPTGDQAGQTITHWLYALHVANVWGWPWRLIVAALGIIVTMLSVTGILIWMRKRAAKSEQT
ncbi:PepSY domain-containing protein [Pseudomonas nabeulensis]|uniref:PepSY domain-containing protein n=1 Tax=Pseudomonas nabeulensis TaxID=2293833 RepID=A0A4Z0BA27_9PSED|nr:PepSY-associated TM helix domain-containing protein [Pseudomonas nabeulensis]TFY95174.1 PepSY domain-containing protein [Pseudomonas nabeulensis]